MAGGGPSPAGEGSTIHGVHCAEIPNSGPLRHLGPRGWKVQGVVPRLLRVVRVREPILVRVSAGSRLPVTCTPGQAESPVLVSLSQEHYHGS